ncbi:MAG: HEAT repeat domain-containing protein [Armatimonadia bacterium]
MDENTRRQTTWIVIAAVALSLFIYAGGRRGELNRLRGEIAFGSPQQRVNAVKQLVDSQKLAEGLADQPRWVQDNAVEAIPYIGTEKAIFQLMTCWTVVDAPVQPRITATVSQFGPLAIPPLVEALTDKDAKVRAGAPAVLTAIGEPVIPYLLPIMGAWDDYIRTGVATVFGGVGEPVSEDLVKIIERGKPAPDQEAAEYNRERECAVTSLLNMKLVAIPALTGKLLVSESPEVRGQAATMIGTIGAGVKPEEAPECLPPLTKAIADSNWGVRRKAAAALGSMGQFALIGNTGTVLMQRLKDPRMEVRAAAAEALGKIETAPIRETAAKTVQKLMEDAAAKAAEEAAAAAPPPAAGAAPAAAGAAPAAAAAPAKPVIVGPDPKTYKLAEALQAANVMAGMLINAPSGASRDISVALVRIGAPAIAPLQPALASGNAEVRLLATQTIAEIGGPGSIGYLAKALRDSSSSDVRQVASDALRNAAPESLQGAAGSVIPALAAALTDPEWQVYYAARDAMAKIGAPAVPSLVSALNNPNTRVGHMAETALTRIGAPAVPQLVQALVGGNAQVRNWASIALGEISEPSVEPLQKVIGNAATSAPARAAAAAALGGTGMPAALAPLQKAAGAPEPEVRIAALRALVKLGSPDGTKYLVAGLSDPVVPVRDVAMDLLKNWRMDPVDKLLQEVQSSGTPDAKHRAAIASVFAQSSVTNQLLQEVSTAAPQQPGAAVAATASPQPVLVEAALDATSPANVRRDAIVALGYVGDQQAITQLQSLLKPGEPMALPSAKAIAMVAVRQAAAIKENVTDKMGATGKMLIGLVKDGSKPDLQLAAATALSNMQDLPVDELINSLATADDATKAWSAAILAAIGKPATDKVLRIRGSSKDITQKQWLASTLKIIGDAMALQLMKHLADNEKPQDAQVQTIQQRLDQIRKAQG